MGGLGRIGRGVVCALAVTLGAGCFSPPAEAVARLAEVQAENAELDSALAGLEERFLGNQYMVQLWQELGRRHRAVSEVACKVHGNHFAAMSQHLERQTEKARALRRQKSVANATLSRGMGGPRER